MEYLIILIIILVLIDKIGKNKDKSLLTQGFLWLNFIRGFFIYNKDKSTFQQE